MIVKNEAAVLGRCLASVRPILSHWIICDTGSSDGTQKVVEELLRGIPGSLHEVPWINFGHNRTVALELARGKGDYHLLVDADMTVNVQGEFRDGLNADSYFVRCEGELDYWVERLVSDRHSWHYIGSTHEYIYSETMRSREKLSQISVTHHEDGAARKEKYQRDIALLKKDVEEEPGNARAVFYLAQSYRDTGNLMQAVEWYERQATMGGWEEEAWYSLYQVARLQDRVGMAWPIVFEKYLAAYDYRPSRLEPIFHIAKVFRERGQYRIGMLFSRLAFETPYPEDILFIEKAIYEYGLFVEYAICCQGAGHFGEARRANERVLASPDVPEAFRDAAGKRLEDISKMI